MLQTEYNEGHIFIIVDKSVIHCLFLELALEQQSDRSWWIYKATLQILQAHSSHTVPAVFGVSVCSKLGFVPVRVPGTDSNFSQLSFSPQFKKWIQCTASEMQELFVLQNHLCEIDHCILPELEKFIWIILIDGKFIIVSFSSTQISQFTESFVRNSFALFAPCSRAVKTSSFVDLWKKEKIKNSSFCLSNTNILTELWTARNSTSATAEICIHLDH